MGEIKIVKKGEVVYIVIKDKEIAEELLTLEGAEIFKLKQGFYLITPKLGIKKEKTRKAGGERLSKEELKLLIKLSLIKYEKRHLRYLRRALRKEEKEMLKEFIKRGIVKTKKKGNDTYIVFSDYMYERLKDETKKAKERKRLSEIINIENKFFIVPKEKIKEFMENIDKRRFAYCIGSDGLLYSAEKKAAKKLYGKILTTLKKGKASLEEISNRVNVKEEVALILLRLLSEEGLVYEPEKNIFALV